MNKKTHHKRQLPISEYQKRFFLEWVLAPEDNTDNVSLVYKMTGKLDKKALKQVCEIFIQNNEVVHARYTAEGKSYYDKNYTLDDFYHVVVAQPDVPIKQQLRTILDKPFRLNQDVLLRFYLVRGTHNEYHFIILMQHIIADANFAVQIVTQVQMAYNSLCRGELPNIKIDGSFTQAEVAEQKFLTSIYKHQARQYWLDFIADHPLQVALPYKANVKSTDLDLQLSDKAGKCIYFDLSKQQTVQLKKYAKDKRASLFMVLSALYGLVLSKYSNQATLLFSYPVDMRPREFKTATGCFVNNVPLKLEYDKYRTIEDLIVALTQQRKEVKAYQGYSLTDIIQDQRTLNNNHSHDFFNVGFAPAHLNSMPLDLDAVTVKSVDVACSDKITQHMALLYDEYVVDRIKFKFEYRQALFDPPLVKGFIAAFKALLDSVVQCENIDIKHYCVLSRADYQKIVVDWNQTDQDYPKDKTIPQLFEAQVAKTPNNIAVVFEDEQLTYAELNTKANQLARYLRSQADIKPDTLIALCLDRSLEMIIGILGILKAGGAYVPIDPQYPVARIQYILNDTKTTLLLTQSHLINKLQNIAELNLIALDSNCYQDQTSENLPAQSKATTTNLAYVIYTSGSTGNPKGVMVGHGQFSAFILNFAKQSFIDSLTNLNVLSLTDHTFDIFGLEFGLPLSFGSCIYLADFMDINHSHLQQSSIIQQTPHVMSAVCDSQKDLLNDKLCLVGGEHLLVNIAEKLLKSFKQVVNVYGPSEAVIWSASYKLSKGKDVLIGQALFNEKLYVLDIHNNPVPIGVIGELHIGGVGVARGYLNREDLTQQKFIKNSFATEQDKQQGYDRLYKTGDLVRWLPSGNLEYIGRNDFQVKIRGFRIELGEIENALTAISGIKQAYVLAQEKSGNKFLIAYYIVDKEIKEQNILDQLGKKLPDYMRPSYLVKMDSFPLTINGKLDRNALPMPKFNKVDDTQRFSDDEAAVRDIWVEVLSIDKDYIGLDTDFFSLGGTSLLAGRLLGKLLEKTGVILSLADIFQCATLRKLADKLREMAGDIQTLPLIKKQHASTLPLSFAQRRLWLAYQVLYKQQPQAYNLKISLRLQGYLDDAALQQTLQSLIDRHQILRTYFPQIGVQAIGSFKLRLERCTLKQSTQNINTLMADIADHHFGDLSTLPLLRAVLIKIKKNEHVLCLVFHHIIIDGLSLPSFLCEFAIFYRHYAQGDVLTLPNLPLQYADFTLWQQQRFFDGYYKDALAYWQEQLKDASGFLALPLDKPRPQQPSYQGKAYIFHGTISLTTALKRLAQQNKVSLFTVLLSSVAILLYRYEQQNDFILGIAHGGRPHPSFKEMLGFFVNMLPIRIRQQNDLSVIQLLQQIHHSLSKAYEHDAPLETIIANLGLSERVASHPLFQVSVTLHDMPPLAAEFDELNMSLWEPSVVETSNLHSAKFDLSLEFEELDDGRLVIKIEYASDLFYPETIERMAHQWLILSKAMTQSPMMAIAALPILSSKHQQQRTAKWSENIADDVAKHSVLAVFNKQVQQRPTAIAIIDGKFRLSYRKLNAQANQLAHYLHAMYYKKIKASNNQQGVIAIVLDNSAEAIITILACLKIGIAYVPIDTRNPQKRIRFILSDADCKVVITIAKHREKCQTADCVVLCLDQIQDALDQSPSCNLEVTISPDTLMYILYTSGTTGEPKGVMQTVGNVANLFISAEKCLSFSHRDTWLLFHSLAFDFSVWEVWGALYYGGQLVIADPETISDPDRLYACVQHHHITVLNQTPSAFQGFMRVCQAHSTKVLPLRYLIFGGESLNLHSLSQWWRQYNDTKPILVNMYGITEVTVHATYKVLNQADLMRRETSNIGVPLPGRKTFIVDSAMRSVPIGLPGELLIAGGGLARGYLKRPTLTSEKFIFYKKLRCYRTGDLVRQLADGSLEYLGRVDHQLKFRGIRMESGEIETALYTCPGIAHCVVAIQNDDNNIPTLVAYYSLQANISHKPTPVLLKKLLRQSLPEYMIPNLFILLDHMPLTYNGKVDKQALPTLAAHHYDLSSETHMSMTAPQKKLAHIWEKYLHVTSIGLEDNFFSSGGDSIIGLQVISAAREQGFSCQVSDLFRYQTIRSLTEACWVEEVTSVAQKKTTCFSLISASDREKLPSSSVDAYPMAALQLGMVYHANAVPEAAVYLDIFRYRIQAVYDEDVLKQVLLKLVDAHPILRTTFHLTGYSCPLQIVHDHLPILWDIQNITEQNHIQQAETLLTWLTQQKAISFNIENAPLYRITIHRLSSTAFEIGLVFHHAILDGWSVATFMTAWLSAYSAQLKGEKSRTYLVDDNYRAYIQLEQQAADSSDQKQFWQNELAGFQYTDIPSWYVEQPNDNGFERFSMTLEKPLTRQLISLAAMLGVSIDVVLLAALVKLLAILSGNTEEVLLGVVFNGRPSIKNSDKTLGLFLNTLPFRLSTTQQSTWQELIQAVAHKKSVLYPHRRYPLMKIQQNLTVDKLFNVLFYFTHFHVYDGLQSLDNLDIVEQNYYERTNFPLTFNISYASRSDDLAFNINYVTRYYQSDQIQELSVYFVRILSAMADQHSASHRCFSPLTEQDKRELLVEWNQTDIDYDLSMPIHQHIEEQARRMPAHIALCYHDGSLSYQALNKRANALAHALSKRGVRPREPVVLYTDRNIDAVVTLYAILKVGAIYVPIDSLQPRERVLILLKDLNPSLICIQEPYLASLRGTLYQDRLFDLSKFFDKSLPVDDVVYATYPSHQEDIAYIIYTSGSTGKPKGIMIRHNALLNFLFAMADIIQFDQTDRLLALTSFSFDISLLEILLPLLKGGTCVLADKEQKYDPRWIRDTLEKRHITCLQATPTTWKMLFDTGYALSSGIKALCGGESLIPEVAMHFRSSNTAWNVYGPTETTIWSTCCRIQSNSLYPVAIGKPIANTKVYVLDHSMQLVPVGVPGELYITGMGVAKAYLHQSSLTKEKFIDNPFNTNDQSQYSRLYKTGDLVRWLPNGSLFFMGRTDHQFKLRGFRIESGDIESALSSHESVKECAILVKEVDGIDHLIAYTVLYQPNEIIDEKKIRTFLLKKIPYYMLPDKLIFIDNIPININGKIDIKKLFSLDIEKTKLLEQEKKYLLTKEQKSVADIWCRVLNIQSISPNDNFYDLGGNSILSLIALQNINDHFSTDLSIRDFIEHPTLSDLSDFIIGHRRKDKKNNVRIEGLNFIKKISDPIVTLKKQGKQTPLFLIHPVGGTVFCYIPLVKHLLSDRPIYAIQDPGIETQDRLFSSLSEMIEFYISVIKKYQSHGPYYIAGSSFGANAAVEMTQQLIKQGESVAFTGLIDGWAKYPDRANKDKKWFGNNLKTQMRAMRTLLPEAHFSDLFLDLHWHRQQLLIQHDLPNNLDLNLTLFKAQETMGVLKPLESPHNNWELYCSVPPTTYIVPGDHFTMHFEPNVNQLAKVLDNCLAELSTKFNRE